MSKRSDKEIIEEITRVECELSPENLTHDGELNAKQWKPRQKLLVARKASLIQELGRTPSDKELWS
jgi:hypothetical protein